MIGVSDVLNRHLGGSRFSLRNLERTEKIIIIQGPFHLPQLFPQRKYRGKQRFSYYEFLFRIYKVIFFNWPPFVQNQNEKRPTSQTEALLDEGFHGRAFFTFGTELGWQVEKNHFVFEIS